MVMPHAFRVESRGAAFDGNFTNQTRLHQVAKIIISGGSGRARIHTIYGFENFRCRGMTVVFH